MSMRSVNPHRSPRWLTVFTWLPCSGFSAPNKHHHSRCKAPRRGRPLQARFDPYGSMEIGEFHLNFYAIYMDSSGFIWILTDLHGFIWVYVDLYRFIWILLNLYGFISICMGLCGFIRVYVGFIWRFWGYISLWIQPFLLRKWNWGMILVVSCTFSGGVWIYRVCISLYYIIY